MLIEDIAQFLNSTNIGVWDEDGTDGDIYLATLPSDKVNVIAIYPRGGQENSLNSQEQNASVQFIIRDENTLSGLERGNTVIKSMHGFNSDTFIDGGHYVIDCLATTGQPVDLGLDSNNRHEWSINFNITFI